MKKVKFNNNVYRVKKLSNLNEFGWTDFKNKEIVVNKDTSRAFETLMHEIAHVFAFELGLVDKVEDESFIQLFALTLFNFVKDNKRLVEKIMIGDTNDLR